VILAALPVLLLLPIVSLARNYHHCDRSRNYIAYSYAWNLLNSADKDAVLFTFGDNDTFPLWCLQEALGVRRDVKVVNLTLSNAKWYVKQIQNTLKVDLGWTDNTIDRLRSYRLQDGTPYLLQDQVVTTIIANNFGRRPINFSVTVGSRYRRYQGRSLDNRLLLTGMSWRLLDSGERISVDVEEAYDFFTNPQKFRDGGLDDPRVFKSETALRLSGNYATGMLRVAEELEGLGDYDRAEELIRKTIRLVPHYPNAVDPLAAIMSRQGRLSELQALVDTTDSSDRAWLNTVLARTEIKYGDAQKAERILNGVLISNPTYRTALDELMRLYFDTKNVLGMKVLLQRWLQFNPGDEKIRMMLMELQKGIVKDSSG
jgi:tetratricopeptide (TPR) repeat protein